MMLSFVHMSQEEEITNFFFLLRKKIFKISQFQYCCYQCTVNLMLIKFSQLTLLLSLFSLNDYSLSFFH